MIFVTRPFVALAVAVVLAPSETFLDFLFPSYGLFRGLWAEKWPFLAIPTLLKEVPLILVRI